MVTACRVVISAGVIAPDNVPRIWRWQGIERTQLHDTAGEARVLSPARDRLAIDLGQSLRVLTIADGMARDVAYPVDLVGLDWMGGAQMLVQGRSAAGDRLDLIDPATGDIHPLVADDTHRITSPRLSPDGQLVGFLRDGAVLQVPVTGGAPTTRVAARSPAIAEFIGSRDRRILSTRRIRRIQQRPTAPPVLYARLVRGRVERSRVAGRHAARDPGFLAP